MSEWLWIPSLERIEASNLTRFLRYVNESCGLELDGYDALYDWSVAEPERFWDRMYHFGGIVASEPYTEVLADAKMPGATSLA